MNKTVLLGDRPGVPPMAAMPDAEEIDVAGLLKAYRSSEIDLICVLGPTASGKTRYAVSLARQINRLEGKAVAEILSGDSRQVYRGMDIGTGKDIKEYEEIPYHLIDIAPAGFKYSIYDFQKDFENAFTDIRNRGGVAILCGGSGLYLQAATCGYRLPNVPPQMEIRAELDKLDDKEIAKRLLDLKPDVTNGTLESRRRMIRALEVAIYEKDHPIVWSSFLPRSTYYIGTLVSREERVRRIDRRLDERLEEGMIEEVRGLIDSGVSPEDLVYYGLEYKFVTQFIMGELSYDDMKVGLANAIHQFAKRQMTWFRGMERDGIRIHWTKV